MEMDEVYPICPICDEECETIYKDKNTGDVIGCDRCIESEDAVEWQSEQDIDEEAIKADYYIDYLKDMRCDNE